MRGASLRSTSRPACCCPPAEAAARVPAAHRSTAPRRRRRRPCRGGAPPPAPGPRRPSRWAFVRVTRARARARAARREARPRGDSCSQAQVEPERAVEAPGYFRPIRYALGTGHPRRRRGAGRARYDSPKIARRSSAKAQMAFFDERRSYVTVRQVPPNFSQYLSKKSWRCSFCSACFVAHAYAFDGSM